MQAGNGKAAWQRLGLPQTSNLPPAAPLPLLPPAPADAPCPPVALLGTVEGTAGMLRGSPTQPTRWHRAQGARGSPAHGRAAVSRGKMKGQRHEGN